MKAVIALVLLAVAAVNGGYLTHDVAYSAPLVHAPVVHAAPAAVIHTATSTSYKYKAPPAKFVAAAPYAVAHPSLPLVHAAPVMSHGVFLH